MQAYYFFIWKYTWNWVLFLMHHHTFRHRVFINFLPKLQPAELRLLHRDWKWQKAAGNLQPLEPGDNIMNSCWDPCSVNPITTLITWRPTTGKSKVHLVLNDSTKGYSIVKIVCLPFLWPYILERQRSQIALCHHPHTCTSVSSSSFVFLMMPWPEAEFVSEGPNYGAMYWSPFLLRRFIQQSQIPVYVTGCLEYLESNNFMMKGSIWTKKTAKSLWLCGLFSFAILACSYLEKYCSIMNWMDILTRLTRSNAESWSLLAGLI